MSGPQYGRSQLEDDAPRQRARNRELSERLDRMEQDRDEQVRRLFRALGGVITISSAERLADTLYDAGARIPDPPRYGNEDERRKAMRKAGEWLDLLTPEDAKTVIQGWETKPVPPKPSLPVVTERALAIFNGHYFGPATNSAEQGLRAAFPIMLRDTVGTITDTELMHLALTGSYAHTWSAIEFRTALIRALSGSAATAKGTTE